MTTPTDHGLLLRVATCIGCGCDDTRACWDDEAGQPCHWVRLDRRNGLGVCSVCKEEHAARWDAGDREVAVPVGPLDTLDRTKPLRISGCRVMKARTELEKVLNLDVALRGLHEPIDGADVELRGDEVAQLVDWLESTPFWGRAIGRSLKCFGEDGAGNEFLSAWMTVAQFGRLVTDGKDHPALKALAERPEEWKAKGAEFVYFDGYRKPR